MIRKVQKDAEYVIKDVAKRKENIAMDNGGDLNTRYELEHNKIEEDCKIIADWKVI